MGLQSGLRFDFCLLPPSDSPSNAIEAKRVMNGLQMVTGLSGNMLAKRPFFVFWFMGHISRSLRLWKLDH